MKRVFMNTRLIAFVSVWLAIFIVCSILSGIAYSNIQNAPAENDKNKPTPHTTQKTAQTTPAPAPQTTPAEPSPYDQLTYSASNAQYIIYLDAGHGWYDNGTSVKVNGEGIIDPEGEYVFEKNITLAMTKKLKQALEKMGYTVGETRPGDNDSDCPIPLVNGMFYAQDRPGYVNSKNADYFISLHCNSFTDSTAYGTRIYYSPNFAENTTFANSVSQSLMADLGDRMQREVRLYSGNELAIPRESAMPTLLIETGFLTNQTDLDMLIDPAWQDKFVCAVAKGLDAHIHAES